MSSSSNKKKNKAGPIFGPLVFNVYKPEGMTSTDVVRHFKYHLPKGFGKIGHFGTLDPFADGVLLIAVGQAPRFNNYVHERYPKSYKAIGLLGVESPTGDLTGDGGEMTTVVCPEFSDEKLALVLNSFLGKYEQSPPAFSATKHKGKPLYEWAREGVIIEKPPVLREITHIELISRKGLEIEFLVTASSGTYIRVLFEDIAKKLGTHGALKNLKRVSIGPATSSCAIKEIDWPKRDGPFDMEKMGCPVDEFLDFEKISLSYILGIKFFNGLAMHQDLLDGYYWIYCEEQLLGLGEVEGNVLRSRVGLGVRPLEKKLT